MKLDFDTIEFWNNLNSKDKRILTGQMLALFPEVFGKRSDKYNRPALWLIEKKMTILPNFRDIFSAGGKKIKILNKITVSISAVIHKLEEFSDEIKSYLKNNENLDEIRTVWKIKELQHGQTLDYWKKKVHTEIKREFESINVAPEKYIDSLY